MFSNELMYIQHPILVRILDPCNKLLVLSLVYNLKAECGSCLAQTSCYKYEGLYILHIAGHEE